MNTVNTSKESSLSSLNMSNEVIEAISARNAAKDLLKQRIFLGRYLERRLVDKIGYRDVVLVSAAETEFNRDLMAMKTKLLKTAKYFWIGVTFDDDLGYANSGIYIWTEIDNQPLGPFWFQVKTITFREKEVIVKVKCLRYISESFLELEPLLTQGSAAKVKDSVTKSKADIIPIPDQESITGFIETFKTAVSVRNIKDFVTFIVALLIAVCTGSVGFVNFLGNFVLALLRESSLFVKNATPMFLGVLDFFSKIVGGFYILLAMIFRQNAPPPASNKRRIQYYSQDNYNYDGSFD